MWKMIPCLQLDTNWLKSNNINNSKVLLFYYCTSHKNLMIVCVTDNYRATAYVYFNYFKCIFQILAICEYFLSHTSLRSQTTGIVNMN